MFRVVGGNNAESVSYVESAVIERVHAEKSDDIGSLGWLWNMRHTIDDTVCNFWVSPMHNVPFPRAVTGDGGHVEDCPDGDLSIFAESLAGTRVDGDDDDDDECILIEEIMAIINSSNACDETADGHAVVYSPPILSPSPVRAVDVGSPAKSPSPTVVATEKKVEVITTKSSPPRYHRVDTYSKGAEDTRRKYVRGRGRISQQRFRRARSRYYKAHIRAKRTDKPPQKAEDKK